jgi:hypothetical protein
MARRRDALYLRGKTWYLDCCVLFHLISGQFVEHCKLSFLQRIQSASNPHFLRDIQAHSLVTLVRDLRLVSVTMSLEQIRWVSCIQLTMLAVHNLSGGQHSPQSGQFTSILSGRFSSWNWLHFARIAFFVFPSNQQMLSCVSLNCPKLP